MPRTLQDLRATLACKADATSWSCLGWLDLEPWLQIDLPRQGSVGTDSAMRCSGSSDEDVRLQVPHALTHPTPYTLCHEQDIADQAGMRADVSAPATGVCGLVPP